MEELSEIDTNSIVGSILGVCLDGFNGDAWMSMQKEHKTTFR